MIVSSSLTSSDRHKEVSGAVYIYYLSVHLSLLKNGGTIERGAFTCILVPDEKISRMRFLAPSFPPRSKPSSQAVSAREFTSSDSEGLSSSYHLLVGYARRWIEEA